MGDGVGARARAGREERRTVPDVLVAGLDRAMELQLSGSPQFAGSPSKKVALINNLQDYTSREMYKMPYIQKIIDELHAYPGDLADKGMETDCVMALALVALGAKEYGPLGPPEGLNK